MPGCGVGEGNVSKFKCGTGRRGREKWVRGKEHGRERGRYHYICNFLSLMIVFINTLNSIVQILRIAWYF
jgi:hypothetical protein